LPAGAGALADAGAPAEGAATTVEDAGNDAVEAAADADADADADASPSCGDL